MYSFSSPVSFQTVEANSEHSRVTVVERGGIVHHGRDSVRLQAMSVRPVGVAEESRFQDAMCAHHDLGALPKHREHQRDGHSSPLTYHSLRMIINS